MYDMYTTPWGDMEGKDEEYIDKQREDYLNGVYNKEIKNYFDNFRLLAEQFKKKD